MKARNALLMPRMGSVRLLLLTVMVSTLIAAGLVAALAGFAASALPQAVSSELARSPRTAISIYGGFGAAQARIDRPRVAAALRRAFGLVPFTADVAVWSDPMTLPTPGKTVSLLQAAALDGIRGQVKLTAGRWPSLTAPGGPVEALAPASVAGDLRLPLGRTVVLRDRQSGARVRFRLTGLYRPDNSANPYWALDLIGSSGSSAANGFITYGPLIVPPGAFGGGLATGGVTWLAAPRIAAVGAGQLRPLGHRVGQLLASLAGSPDLGGLQASSGLPAAFAGVATKLVVARSLLLVGVLELLLLAGAALTLTARTLVSQREEESALLAARGAGRWQLARLALAEALLVAVVGTGAGLLIGGRLAWLLARSGQLRAAGLRISGTPADVWLTMAAVLLLCTGVMVWPALRPVSPGAARARKGRAAVVSATARAGGDIALVGLALLAVWQLRRYSVLGRTAGGIDVDPVLALAPAIALAAATVLPLRVLPALASVADRLASRTSRLTGAMTTWEISRRATRQSAPMLLVVLAVGTGTLALAQHQSWRRSALDQSSFAAGADVRADTAVPVPLGRAATITGAPGVRAAMAVTTSLTVSSGGQVLALDARQAPATVLLRGDQSALPAGALWRKLRPAPMPEAVTLPGRPARLEISASLAPGSRADLGPVRVSVSIQDAAGAVYAVPAGMLPDDGRTHPLTVSLSATRQAIYPLKLLGIMAGYTLPPVPSRQATAAAAVRQVVFAVRGLAVSASPAGAFAAPFATGQVLAGWTAGVSSADLALAGVGVPPTLATRPAAAGPGTMSFHPGYGQTSPLAPPAVAARMPVFGQLSFVAPAPAAIIPGIATRAFLRSSRLRAGALFQIVAPGPVPLTVRIVAVVTAFPTVTSPQGALIVDQAAVQELIAQQSAPPLSVNQWWLTTRTGAAPPGLPAGAAVTERTRLYAGLLADPMAAIPQQAVQSIAIAAALLAVLGFSVSVAGRVRERRSQTALLSALGVSAAVQVRLLCLEALALSGPAALTGLLLGTLVARLLVPAVTLTAAAAAPVPAVLVEVPLATALVLALAVMAIPVAAAAASAALRPDPAAQLRAGESA
jgi:FtsX-like permease family